MKVPFLRPPFGIKEVLAIQEVMYSNEVSTGQKRIEFEQKFKEYIGCNHALSVCNGSIALELVWQTLIRNGKLRVNDWVLVPSFTFVAVANSIVNSGLVPVFCDIDKDTWNLKAQWNNQDISAICGVHTFGNPCNIDELLFLQDKGLIIVEDCAEACGAEYKGRKVGSFGDASIFSFSATKNMTTGEGGVACFKEKEDAKTALLLKENGFGYGARNAQITGHNYRLSNLQCAIGIEQLKTLDNRNMKRDNKATDFINNMYDNLGNKIDIQKIEDTNRTSAQILGILVDNRDKVLDHLIKNGIEAKKYFDPPIHKQDAYRHRYGNKLPITEEIASKIICLPFDDKLSTEEMDYMVSKLSEVL